LPISVFLADDHPVLRHGLRSSLEAHRDFVIVGEASDGHETVRLVQQLKPNVVVLDVMLPGLNGLTVAHRIKKDAPHTRVVFFTMYSNEAFVVEAFKHGALGYVLKCAEPHHVVSAIREAAAGRRYLSPPLTERMVADYLRKAKSVPFDPNETLTPREREVLQLAAEGNSSTAIAARFRISPRTVEMHRANLMRKLGLRNQTELVRYALRRGIIAAE
jgi:DNA-binding NarL/FixJ family response regulator